MSSAFALVEAINRLDIAHRRGWFPSEKPNAIDVLPDLEREVVEFREALERYELVRRWPELHDIAHDPREELADVFAVVLQAALRLGMSFKELDSETVRKLKLRFPGA